jgi:hypothetical protein
VKQQHKAQQQHYEQQQQQPCLAAGCSVQDDRFCTFLDAVRDIATIGFRTAEDKRTACRTTCCCSPLLPASREPRSDSLVASEQAVLPKVFGLEELRVLLCKRASPRCCCSTPTGIKNGCTDRKRCGMKVAMYSAELAEQSCNVTL